MSNALKATLQVEGTELARVLNNALAFVPARSLYLGVRLSIDSERVSTLAGDEYTLGSDWAKVESYNGPDTGLSVTLSRSDAQALEKSSRFDKHGKSHGIGTLEVMPDDAVVYTPELEGKDGALCRPIKEEHLEKLWQVSDELLEKLDRDWDFQTPQAIAFQPELMGRFAKVKPLNEDDAVMDLWVYDDSAPVLVKIGQTFIGAIMPITRDKAREGDLWDES